MAFSGFPSLAENQLGILMPHTRWPIESIERVLHLPRATNRKTAEKHNSWNCIQRGKENVINNIPVVDETVCVSMCVCLCLLTAPKIIIILNEN